MLISSIVTLKDMDKHIYLRNIQDTNETLYRLVQNHVSEMMLIIYTPNQQQRVKTEYLPPWSWFIRLICQQR